MSLRIILMLFLAVLAGMAIAGARAQSGAHAEGHAEGHDTYSTWQRPDVGGSCCNDSDCRPTRAYLGEDGRWRAWDGLGWIIIPPGKVLPTDLAKDGRSHICASPEGAVYCFSPAGPRS